MRECAIRVQEGLQSRWGWTHLGVVGLMLWSVVERMGLSLLLLLLLLLLSNHLSKKLGSSVSLIKFSVCNVTE